MCVCGGGYRSHFSSVTSHWKCFLLSSLSIFCFSPGSFPPIHPCGGGGVPGVHYWASISVSSDAEAPSCPPFSWTQASSCSPSYLFFGPLPILRQHYFRVLWGHLAPLPQCSCLAWDMNCVFSTLCSAGGPWLERCLVDEVVSVELAG